MLTIQEWFLSAIAIAGGAGGVFFLLFQFVGKTWLENKFTQRLDYLRHQHDIEVARLRVEIDSMLNGTLKLQEKEFEILPVGVLNFSGSRVSMETLMRFTPQSANSSA